MEIAFGFLILRPYVFHARLASGNDLYVIASVVARLFSQHSVYNILHLLLRLFDLFETAGTVQLLLAQPQTKDALQLQHICLELSEHVCVHDYQGIAVLVFFQLLLMGSPVVQEDARQFCLYALNLVRVVGPPVIQRVLELLEFLLVFQGAQV